MSIYYSTYLVNGIDLTNYLHKNPFFDEAEFINEDTFREWYALTLEPEATELSYSEQCKIARDANWPILITVGDSVCW